MWLRVLFLLFHWNQLIVLITGLECTCTTYECESEGKTTCIAKHWCYSEKHNGEITRGCINKRHPIQCDNKKSSKFSIWPLATHCCKKDFCNKEIIPTSPAEPDSRRNEKQTEKNIILPQKESSKCINSHENNTETSKMINPIYIAVPVAGVCVLLALIIFAMYLLRKRTDYYERYKYPTTVSVPPHHHHHHHDCSESKCSNTCKLNRCTDSERSSSGSETKLFL